MHLFLRFTCLYSKRWADLFETKFDHMDIQQELSLLKPSRSELLGWSFSGSKMALSLQWFYKSNDKSKEKTLTYENLALGGVHLSVRAHSGKAFIKLHGKCAAHKNSKKQLKNSGPVEIELFPARLCFYQHSAKDELGGGSKEPLPKSNASHKGSVLAQSTPVIPDVIYYQDGSVFTTSPTQEQGIGSSKISGVLKSNSGLPDAHFPALTHMLIEDFWGKSVSGKSQIIVDGCFERGSLKEAETGVAAFLSFSEGRITQKFKSEKITISYCFYPKKEQKKERLVICVENNCDSVCKGDTRVLNVESDKVNPQTFFSAKWRAQGEFVNESLNVSGELIAHSFGGRKYTMKIKLPWFYATTRKIGGLGSVMGSNKGELEAFSRAFGICWIGQIVRTQAPNRGMYLRAQKGSFTLFPGKPVFPIRSADRVTPIPLDFLPVVVGILNSAVVEPITEGQPGKLIMQDSMGGLKQFSPEIYYNELPKYSGSSEPIIAGFVYNGGLQEGDDDSYRATGYLRNP
ncbi:MAG: hypothetical protein HC848_04880 [Limnobacter sp.]|nr:hypothetical protein [Limnobacter sp.]